MVMDSSVDGVIIGSARGQHIPEAGKSMTRARSSAHLFK
jgi:hypothetical protein